MNKVNKNKNFLYKDLFVFMMTYFVFGFLFFFFEVNLLLYKFIWLDIGLFGLIIVTLMNKHNL